MSTNFIQLSEHEKELLYSLFLILKKLLGTPECVAQPCRMLDPAAVMRMLNISRSTLFRMRKSGQLVPARIGGHDYYRESDIMDFFKP